MSRHGQAWPGTARLPLPHERNRVTTSTYHWLVFVDGRKTAHHVADPLAAIHAAEREKDADWDRDIVIVVLNDEEASMTAAEYAVRPLVPAPAEKAAQAVAAAVGKAAA